MRRIALPAIATALLVAALAVPGVASPQPTPMCGYCGPGFEQAAEDAGVNVTVANSTALVAVHRNGTATWTVRNRLSEGATRLRDSPGGVGDVAARLVGEYYGLPEDPTLVDARLEGSTAVVVLRSSGVGSRHAGLLVVDLLHDDARRPWYHVNTERFTIRGPDGTVVTNDPESGTVEGRSVTWHGESGRTYEAPDLEGSPYVVFGPDRSGATAARTVAALSLATLPIAVGGISSFVLFQTLVYGAVLAGVVWLLRNRAEDVRVEPLAGVLVGLGLLGLAAPLVQGAPGWVTGLQLFAVGLGALVWYAQDRSELPGPREQALASAGLLVLSFVGTAVVRAVVPLPGASGVLVAAARSTLAAVPFAALLPLGATLARAEGVPLRWWAVAAVAFAALPLSMVSPVDPPVGLGGGLTSMFLYAVAVLAPLAGAVVVVVGRSLADEGTVRVA